MAEKRQSGLFKGWLEQHQAEKLEKEIRELDEKVGLVLMLKRVRLSDLCRLMEV